MPEPTAARTTTLLTTAVLVIALAVVFLVGLSINEGDDPVAASAPTGNNQPRGIITAGEGVSEGRPDQVRFSATVTNRRDTSALAQAATNHDVRAVTITLKKNGVEAKDIQTAGLSIEPRYDYRDRGPDGPRLIGYTSTQRIKVLVRKLDLAGETLGGVTRAAGNAVQVNGIALTFSDKDAIIAKARTEAVQKSKAAAVALAKAAGRDVGELEYVEEVEPRRYYYEDTNYFQRAALNSLTKMADATASRARSVPISPGQQEFTVTVKVRWSIS